MINLRNFSDHRQYAAQEDRIDRPQVSYCINQKEVHYDPKYVKISGKISVPHRSFTEEGYYPCTRSFSTDLNFSTMYYYKNFLTYESGDEIELSNFETWTDTDESGNTVNAEKGTFSALYIDEDTGNILNNTFKFYEQDPETGEWVVSKIGYYVLYCDITKYTYENGDVRWGFDGASYMPSNIGGERYPVYGECVPAFETRNEIIVDYMYERDEYEEIPCVYVRMNEETQNGVLTRCSDVSADMVTRTLPRIATPEMLNWDQLLSISVNGDELDLEELRVNQGLKHLPDGTYDIEYKLKPFCTEIPMNIMHDIPLDEMEIDKRLRFIDPNNFYNMPLIGTKEEVIQQIFGFCEVVEVVFEDDFTNSKGEVVAVHEGKVGLGLCGTRENESVSGDLK